uniref:Ribosomal protein S11 n=1 Tax=Thraustochytrium aureum TaxID=42467 RepID=Q9G4D2_9STRA|nr:ribosomal protein S11 [Thraustochytrium aureum]
MQKQQSDSIKVVNLIVRVTKNNIHLNLLDSNSVCLAKASVGLFTKRLKKNPFSITKMLHSFCNKIPSSFLLNLVFIGFTKSHFMIIKSLVEGRFVINRLFFVNTKPYNGCRRKKKRRL